MSRKYSIRLKVKEYADNKHIGQGKLARAIDADTKTIQRIFRDPGVNITMETLVKIANALDVDPRDLIETIVTEEEGEK